MSGDDLAEAIAKFSAPGVPGAAAGKTCPNCTFIVQRKGKGEDARLVCGCTPIEVAA